MSQFHLATLPIPQQELHIPYFFLLCGYMGIIIEFFIAVRFLLKLMGANITNTFTQFIYTFTYPFIQPFGNALQSYKLDLHILELSTLFSIIFYAVILWLCKEIITAFIIVLSNERDNKITL